MDTEFENMFIKNFFDRQFCDRLQYELSSSKKRIKFFSRIAHECEKYIKHQYIVDKDNMLLPRKLICKYILTKECYVIAYNDDYDGQFVRFEDALNKLWSNGSPYVLVNTSCDCTYIETEYNFSEHCSYILKL